MAVSCISILLMKSVEEAMRDDLELFVVFCIISTASCRIWTSLLSWNLTLMKIIGCLYIDKLWMISS